MTVPLPEPARRLLDRRVFAHVATVGADGAPQSTPVWVEREGDVVVFNTAYGRAKTANLVREPRVAISIHDPDDPYHYVQIRGRAELVDEGAEETIDRLSHKYDGTDYPFVEGQRRVTVRVTPSSVFVRPG
jgi:PPOX class probable F420-dependent enzyme